MNSRKKARVYMATYAVVLELCVISYMNMYAYKDGLAHLLYRPGPKITTRP